MSFNPASHDHTFGQDRQQPGERRTLAVLIITAVTMVIEIVAGLFYGSMALLADGLHMGSHAVALGISVFAYVYARRNARNKIFCYGTGKVNALGGFSGAFLLGIFAFVMAWQSIERFFNPVEIAFDQSIFVAIAGLIINGISVFILGNGHSHEHDHEVSQAPSNHHHDHNLRAAYFHVLADTLTSVLAIAALLLGKYAGLVWMDPVMGIVGTVLISTWAWKLLRSTSRILLDYQGPGNLFEAVIESVEKDEESSVSDIHLWEIGPDIYAATIVVDSPPGKKPEDYHDSLPDDPRLVHTVIEVSSKKNRVK